MVYQGPFVMIFRFLWGFFFFFGGNSVLVCSGLFFVYLSSGCWKMFMLSRTMYVFNM